MQIIIAVVTSETECRTFALLTVSFRRPLQLKTWVICHGVTQNGLCETEVNH